MHFFRSTIWKQAFIVLTYRKCWYIANLICQTACKKDSIHNICSSCARRNDSWRLTLRSYSPWSIDKHLNYSKRAHSMKENVSSKHTLHYSLASLFPNISTFLSLPSAFSVSCTANIANSAPTYKPYRFLSCDDWYSCLASSIVDNNKFSLSTNGLTCSELIAE